MVRTIVNTCTHQVCEAKHVGNLVPKLPRKYKVRNCLTPTSAVQSVLMNLKVQIQHILEQGYLLSLASVDGGGPWVSDLIYTFDDELNTYWISRPEFRHSKAFITNPRGAGAITTVEKPLGKGMGIQLEGTVIVLAQIPKDALARYTQKRSGKTSWELEPGEAWYKLTPTSIDIINEPEYGFVKKNLRLR